jgi:tRNA(Arg) A34 adenosine deaminase TadA
MQALEPPMARALELAWESFRAGSLGVGATISRHGEVIATGRNRMAERDPGEDVLAGTSLAHAEMNVLAKLRWGTPADGLELWTTLQPCIQCLGAIRLSSVPKVYVLAPDPLFRGIERVRELNEFVARRWPEIVEVRVDEWAAVSLLLHTHFVTFWGVTLDGWDEALPSIAALARDLIASGELMHLAAEATPLAGVATALWDRLGACVPDVERIAEVQPT